MNRPISPTEFFVMGALAKLVATILTYPIQLAQGKMRTQRMGLGPKGKDAQYANFIQCVSKLYEKGGVTGTYKGVTTKLQATVIATAFHFLAYEEIASFVFYLARVQRKLAKKKKLAKEARRLKAPPT